MMVVKEFWVEEYVVLGNRNWTCGYDISISDAYGSDIAPETGHCLGVRGEKIHQYRADEIRFIVNRTIS